MSKYELSVSKDYVPGWGVVDAVRELFQNALDQQTTVSGNKMFFDYNRENGVLTIGNKSSVLSTSSLLLGKTTKRGDADTIGQFGEGYKIATLILCREGKEVTFYNYGAREVWRPRFVNSRRYKSEILTFFVDKKFKWSSVPDNNLTITISGITEEEYEEIVESNLHLSGEGTTIKTDTGTALMDSKHKGKVYVNGLFVCDYMQYAYGYNFRPKDIELDRDRKLVSDFNLQWLASKIWASADESALDTLVDLASNDAVDVRFLSDTAYGDKLISAANKAYKRFLQENGPNAVPVTLLYGTHGLTAQYKPVVVSESFLKLLKKSPLYIEPQRVFPPSLRDKVTYWLDAHEMGMEPDAVNELREILKEEGIF